MAPTRVAVSKYPSHHVSRQKGYANKKVEQCRNKVADPLHNIASSAAYLSSSAGFVKKLVWRGDIETVRIGRAVRIRQSILDAFIAERTMPARPA